MEGAKEAVLLVSAQEQDAATVYDMNTGEKIHHIPDCIAHPCGLAFVDGHFLATSRSDKGQPLFGSAIYFWDPSKLQETHKSYVGEAIGPITCSKDGMYLVGGAHSGKAYIWEVTSGALLKRWCAHKNAISCLAFSQDSSLLISGSIEGRVHTWSMISLFQAEEPQPYRVSERLPNSYNPKAAEHEPSITGILTVLSGHCPMLITSSLDGTCKVTDLMSGALLETLALSSAMTTITVDPLEQILLCGSSDNAVYVTKLTGIAMQNSVPLTLYECDCQMLSGHKAPISALAFSSEGTWLVSASKDCNVLIWDTKTWQVLRKLETEVVGPIMNLLVIPKLVISTVHHQRNSPTLKFAKLEKICKPINELNPFLLPSDFSKDANSTPSYQSADLLSQQILDLEEKRTPEAIEMIVKMNTKDKRRNQKMAKELADMNMLLKWQVLNVLMVRANQD